MENKFFRLTPSMEKLLLVQLEKLKPYIAFDKYIQIKTILDKCILYHQISQLEIEQILQLLNEKSQVETIDESEATESNQEIKTRNAPMDNTFALFHNEYCIRLHNTLMKLQEKDKKKNKAHFIQFD